MRVGHKRRGGIFVRCIGVEHFRVAIVDTDAQIIRHLAVHHLCRIDIAVPEDVREAAIFAEQRHTRRFQAGSVRGVAAARERVAIDVDAFWIRIERVALLVVRVAGFEEAGDDHIGGLVV